MVRRFIGASERRAILKREVTKACACYGNALVKWNGLTMLVDIKIKDKDGKEEIPVSAEIDIDLHLLYSCRDEMLADVVYAMARVARGVVLEQMRKEGAYRIFGFKAL